jgi:hypothetical protein
LSALLDVARSVIALLDVELTRSQLLELAEAAGS